MIDVVVVGAGPAGAFAAASIAKQGMEVLLVERDRFPRWTVCGACLSGVGVAALRAGGAGDVLDRSGALPLERMALSGWGSRVELPLSGGRVLSRAALDAALVDEARAAGAKVVMETRARLGRWTGAGREVELRGPEAPADTLVAAVVVAATGLHALPRLHSAGPGPVPQVAGGSRVGVGAVVEGWDHGPPPGTVRMTVGVPGYVGQVLQEDGSWSVAGALDADWIRGCGGPGPAVRALLESRGVDVGWTVREGWRGTPALTRRRARPAETGVFYLGDAAGYVEPFTGEGMGWALEGAAAVSELAAEAVRGWSPDVEARWDRTYMARVGARQRLCRGIAWLSRRPALARGAIALVARAPWLAGSALGHVADPGGSPETSRSSVPGPAPSHP